MTLQKRFLVIPPLSTGSAIHGLYGDNIGSNILDKANNGTEGYPDDGNKDNNGDGGKTCSAKTVTTTTTATDYLDGPTATITVVTATPTTSGGTGIVTVTTTKTVDGVTGGLVPTISICPPDIDIITVTKTTTVGGGSGLFLLVQRKFDACPTTNVTLPGSTDTITTGATTVTAAGSTATTTITATSTSTVTDIINNQIVTETKTSTVTNTATDTITITFPGTTDTVTITSAGTTNTITQTATTITIAATTTCPTDGSTGGGSSTGGFDYGTCSEPTIKWEYALDRRTEWSWVTNNQNDFPHEPSTTIDTLTDFICNRLRSPCNAPQATLDQCASAAAQVSSSRLQGEELSDLWISLMT
ncbi:hypothetical protein BBP40_001663 [Aspergillus hancockii]|nr:hypothetical protein BBP40_001663 [Aspergillus hancockii]